MNTSDALRIFNINEVGDLTQLHKTYRKLAMQAHPDAGGSSQEFFKLQTAYELLKKSKKSDIKININKKYSYGYKQNQSSFSSNFIQSFDYKIYLLFLVCYICKIRVFSHHGFKVIELRNRFYILSTLPKESMKSPIKFRMKNEYIILKPKLGFYSLDKSNQLFIYFFKGK